MESFIEQYMMYLQEVKKTSKNTIAAYKRDLEKSRCFLMEHGIDDFDKVTFTDLNSYILSLEREGCASSTVSRNVSTLKSFFGYLFRMKMINNEPSMNLKAPKIEKKIPDILTIEEMDRLLSLPDDSFKGIRDKAMLELLYATGLKVTEIVSLHIEDVNLSMRYVRLFDGERERYVPFGETAKKALDRYLTDARDHFIKTPVDWLFVNYTGEQMSRQGFWKTIKNYGEMGGFEGRLTPHTFRHSFAAHMVENGADLKSLQEMLGHADISTTQIYSSFVDSKISSVYTKSHPRK